MANERPYMAVDGGPEKKRRRLSWRSFARSLMLWAALLSFSLPSASQAQDIKAFAKLCHGTCGVSDDLLDYILMAESKVYGIMFAAQKVAYTSILTALTKIQIVSMYYFGVKLPVLMGIDASMISSGQAVEVDAKTKLTQGTVDSSIEDKVLERELKTQTETIQPQETEQFLCNKITACQGPMAMDQFARSVSRMVLEGLAARYRGPMEDGNGPQYAGDNYKKRCGGNATGSAYMSQSETVSNTDCQADTSSPLTSMADADISMSSLDRTVALQVPHMTQKSFTTATGTVTMNVPDLTQGSTSDKDIAEKRAWVNAVEYCAKIAGPRPTPPAGKAMDKADGRTKLAQWQHCASMQDQFLQICADRIAMLSRPDCGDDDYENLCEASLTACSAARDAQTALPDGFRNCDAGESLYQAEYLCNAMCKSSRQFQANTLDRADQASQMTDALMCQVSENAWKEKQQVQDLTFEEAVSEMQDLDACWKGAQ